jgi:lipopolysaccharide/colanic/teichoic acid biosynthesis glycosyltransferase
VSGLSKRRSERLFFLPGADRAEWQTVRHVLNSLDEGTPKYERSTESSRDKRITPVGKFLRKTSLDEPPQLLTFSSETCLLSDRPEMPYVTAAYKPLERRRLSVPQGLTSLCQRSGDRRFRIHEALEYDLYYVENRRISLDFAILLHTLFFAMKGL